MSQHDRLCVVKRRSIVRVMPTSDIGATGRRVAENVRRLRLARELSLRDLSAKLAELGRPILPSGLLKIEHGQRRVDVDDLAALAEVLGVLPGRLLAEGLAEEREAVLDYLGRALADGLLPAARPDSVRRSSSLPDPSSIAALRQEPEHGRG
jgi:transcriptional regulator with XRE-family HTH domain